MRASKASVMASGITHKGGLNSGHQGATSWLSLLLLSALLFLVTGCHLSEEPTETIETPDPPIVEVETDPATPEFSIMISPVENGLRATWSLPEPTAAFVFEDDTVTHRHREDDWVISEGWSFNDGRLSRDDGAEFQSFSIDISQTKRFYDRSYVPLAKVGEVGWLLHTGVFGTGDARFDLGFEGFPEGSVLVKNAQVDPLGRVSDLGKKSLIYAGAQELVETGPRPTIVSPDVPKWLREAVLAEYSSAHNAYEQLFGRSPESEALLALVRIPGDGLKEYKGDVSGSAVGLYVRGYSPENPDRYFLNQVAQLLFHEVFHLWNAGEYQSTDGGQPWLHEGTADYFADRLLRSDAEILSAANLAQVDCLVGLAGESLLTSSSAKSGNMPYRCGYWINFLAEQALLAERDQSIFDLWRDVFESSEDQTYSSGSFLTLLSARLSNDARAPITAIIEGSRYRKPGPHVATKPIGDAYGKDLPGRLLFKLLGSQCEGSYGFWSETDGYLLDTGDRCGYQLAGNPKVTHLNGISMVDEPARAYLSALSRCRRGEELEFAEWKTAALWPMRCPAEVARLPNLYEVTGMQALPSLLGR